MEHPPTYEIATSQDHWTIIAPYIKSNDLCSAAVVCVRWHEIFAPQLWGNPASHFGTENDSVYGDCQRIKKRSLPFVRLYVRRMTHTLRLPPAHAELYEGPHADWLREILTHLPALKCLVVDGLPFFDHASLTALRFHGSSSHKEATSNLQTFNLRLLTASFCSNVTSSGLEGALYRLPHLCYLDLSSTPIANNKAVYRALNTLLNLRILKLRGICLTDEDMELITQSICRRVRILDVRNNNLTDSTVAMLIAGCFGPSTPVNRSRNLVGLDEYEGHYLADFSGEELDYHVRRMLMTDSIEHLAIEDDIDSGIRNLFIADNGITTKGAIGLVQSPSLDVLDIGTLAPQIAKSQTPNGAEELTTFFHDSKFTFLRIDCAIVTRPSARKRHNQPQIELLGDMPLYTPAYAVELDSSPLLKAPLEVHPAVPLLQGKAVDDHLLQASAGVSEFGDRASESPHHFEPTNVNVHDSLPNGTSSTLIQNGNASTKSNSTPNDVKRANISSMSGTELSLSLSQERQARAKYHSNNEDCLIPAMIPKVKTLVLTNVPSASASLDVTNRLKTFLRHCAEEARLARLEASQSYVLPPGRTRHVREREFAKTIFALECLVLEVSPPVKTSIKKVAAWRQQPTLRSSTRDADSEAFWAAAQNDFSFFDDEECGQPQLKSSSLSPSEDIILVTGQSPPQPVVVGETVEQPSMYDVISELSTFRKHAKQAYEAALARGEHDPLGTAHWAGEIKVIRHQTTDAYDSQHPAAYPGYHYR